MNKNKPLTRKQAHALVRPLSPTKPPVERWIVGQPGGPSGPFYSVVSSTGRVIAMQIVDEKYALLIASFPNLLRLLKETIADYQRERVALNVTMDKLEALIAEYDNTSSQNER